MNTYLFDYLNITLWIIINWNSQWHYFCFINYKQAKVFMNNIYFILLRAKIENTSVYLSVFFLVIFSKYLTWKLVISCWIFKIYQSLFYFHFVIAFIQIPDFFMFTMIIFPKPKHLKLHFMTHFSSNKLHSAKCRFNIIVITIIDLVLKCIPK